MRNAIYKVVFTEFGRDTYTDCLGYILHKFSDPFTAQSLDDDIQEALDLLEHAPNSFPICENANLAERQIRRMHLKRHKYKLFYHIDGEYVFIDAILHDKQDYEGCLA